MYTQKLFCKADSQDFAILYVNILYKLEQDFYWENKSMSPEESFFILGEYWACLKDLKKFWFFNKIFLNLIIHF